MASTENWRLRFFTIWSGQALSLVGSGLVQFALVWWLTTETGSATTLALATLVAMMPGVLIGPVAGVFADRWNRRAILVLADGTVALAALALLAVNLTSEMQVWQIYIALAIRSIAGAFHWPTMAATTTLMVPKEQLTRIGGLNQSLDGFSRIVAPPLAALLLSVADISAVLLLDIVTALIAIIPVLIIAIPQPKRAPEEERSAEETGKMGGWVWRDLVDGFNYVRRRRPLVMIVLVAAILNMVLAPAFSLLPLLVNKVFLGGAGELALVETAGGIGVIVGGAILAAWGGFRRRIFTALMGLAGIGVGGLMIGLAPASAFWLVVAGMAIVGAMSAMVNGPIMAVLQVVIEHTMQARVFSLLGSISMAMSPIGLLLAGPFADTFGLRTWYFVGAIVCLVLAAVARAMPDLLDVELTGLHEVAEPDGDALAPASLTKP